MQKKIRNEKARRLAGRRRRVARQIRGAERPRLVVFRSSKHIYAQIVDGETGQTILSTSSLSKGVMGDVAATGNVEAAKLVGKAIADAAQAKKIQRVVFNRNGFLYHGRVKALAEAARKAGLQF